MECGTEKCSTVEIKQGKVMQGKNIHLTDSYQIRSLQVDEFYKYLGMEEKNLIFKDLQIEVSRMWKVEIKTTPVIVRALGTIEENCRKELEMIKGKLSHYEVQKIVLNGTYLERF